MKSEQKMFSTLKRYVPITNSLHRVTSSVVSHLSRSEGFSLESIVEMVRSFGIRHNSAGEIERALQNALQSTVKDTGGMSEECPLAVASKHLKLHWTYRLTGQAAVRVEKREFGEVPRGRITG